ncbi:MAG: hypothetical protein M0011_01405 [Elusimicrobia bacterium]|nr:hypothetical protein [Elusimicrobiota bacterium]
MTTRKAWRAWLAKHHKSAQEIWLIYYKKASGKPSLDYGAAVEEALCYGWIDSVTKGLDKERFAQRFTPRRAKSVLCASNIERLNRLVARKKMTRAGLAAVAHACRSRRGVPGVPGDVDP